jgi:hypothetical protein
MEIQQLYRDALKVLEDGRLAFQAKLSEADSAIEQLHKENPSNPLIDMSEPKRAELRAEISELDREIDRTRRLSKGLKVEGGEKGTELQPGQYRNVRKLATAVQMYLTHCVAPGQPVKVTDLVESRNYAGATVQIRNGKDRGKRKPVEAKHVRIMTADYKTGFASKKLASPFFYDKIRDTVVLKVESEVGAPKAEGRSVSGRRERYSVNPPQVSMLSGSE